MDSARSKMKKHNEASVSLCYPEIECAIRAAALQECMKRQFKTYSTDKDDIQKFMKTLTSEQICQSQYELPACEVVCNNETNHSWKVPISAVASHESQLLCEQKKEARGRVQANPSIANVKAESKIRGKSSSTTTYKENHREDFQMEDIHVPPQASITSQLTKKKQVLYLKVRAPASTPIRVNPGHPVIGGTVIGGISGGVGGGVVGVTSGGIIGGMFGAVLGPPGIALGLLVGGAIGGAIGGSSGVVVIGGAGTGIGAAVGGAVRNNRQFSITARDIFRHLEGFEDEGAIVCCRIKTTHCYDSKQWNLVYNNPA